MPLASIPSPTTAVWHIGWLPIRAYALCIIAGILVACYITDRRMRARGGPENAILDIAVWAVPCGIVGARIYHILTSPELYFGKDGHPINMLKIWEGGLGIWGAVIGGALGAWIACRQLRIPLGFVADALAVGLPVAQAVGRLGNWFNNELYGRMTTLPWGLQVHQMDPNDQGRAAIGPDGKPELLTGLYHPTFLYELIWDLGAALLVYLLDRKHKFGKGRAFALYVMVYTVGRAWIEYLRIDEANHVLGLRLNDWTCLIVFVGALIYFVINRGAPASRLVPDGMGGLRIAQSATDEGEPNPTGEVASKSAGDDADGAADSGDPDPDEPGSDDGSDGAEDSEGKQRSETKK
jgi:prolipoprotein diacylglyceryl transferase